MSAARAIAVLTTLTVARLATAQTSSASPLGIPPVNDAQLTELASQIVLTHNVPGIGIALIDKTGVRALGVAGVRRVGSPDRLQPDDQFHIGSCGKAMTATALARLAERKILSLDASVADLLPVPAADAGWHDVSLLDLLRQRGGLPSGAAESPQLAYLRVEPDPTKARAQLAARLLKAAPRDPGTFQYSNVGYALAGHVAELKTSHPWAQVLKDEVLSPLDLASAGFGPPGPGQPMGHHPTAYPVGTGPLADDPQGLAPAGTLHLSLRDWGKFAAVHLGGGPKGYLSQASLDLLHRPAPHPPGAKDDPGYACGWGVVETRGRATLTHAGSNAYWFAQVMLFPDDGWGILVATNIAGNNGEQACLEASKELVSLSK